MLLSGRPPRFAYRSGTLASVVGLACAVAMSCRTNGRASAWIAAPTISGARPSLLPNRDDSASGSLPRTNLQPRGLEAQKPPALVHRQRFLGLAASDDDKGSENPVPSGPPQSSWQSKWNRAVGTCFATAALWTATASLPSAVIEIPTTTYPQVQESSSSWTAAFPRMSLQSSSAAHAKEMASGSGSRVNKDAESLLRYGLPIQNKEVRKLQSVLEEIKIDISTKRKSAALDKVKKARSLIGSDTSKYTPSCRDAPMCGHILNQMLRELDPLSTALKDSMESFQGSEQERTALDNAYAAQRQVVDSLTLLEEQMVPAGYRTPVPDAYSDLPQLVGRATVEMTLVKTDKSTYDVSGTTFPEAKLVMVIDGYTAPVTAGNFIDLVQKGYYNKMPIQRSDGFVVQTGDPDGEAEGYVGTGSKSVGQGKHGERLIPLEIFVRGDKGPIYETTIEDDGRGGQATVLPFSSYGAMGWAREEYDVNSGGSQFFWLLFDSDLTPAGKNVLDGRYPCFGYVVEGADFLSDVDEGDIIVSAKVTKGAENLKMPASSG